MHNMLVPSCRFESGSAFFDRLFRLGLNLIVFSFEHLFEIRLDLLDCLHIERLLTFGWLLRQGLTRITD
jgi:hypothetical protein